MSEIRNREFRLISALQGLSVAHRVTCKCQTWCFIYHSEGHVVNCHRGGGGHLILHDGQLFPPSRVKIIEVYNLKWLPLAIVTLGTI